VKRQAAGDEEKSNLAVRASRNIENQQGRYNHLLRVEMPHPICQTSRLVVRELTMNDLEPLTAMHLDPEVCRFIGLRTPEQTRNVLNEWIASYHSRGFAMWAVVSRETGQLIGRCGITPQEYEKISEPELGWTFARAHWGFGYATEAATAVMKHWFEVLKFPRIISLIYPQNVASQRVAERIGMTFERQVQWNAKPANLFLKLGQ
jgi:ribosomal-protein-alanine N-acetyltransferase